MSKKAEINGEEKQAAYHYWLAETMKELNHKLWAVFSPSCDLCPIIMVCAQLGEVGKS